MGTERAPHLDADPAAGERRQHGLSRWRLRSRLRRHRLGGLSKEFDALNRGLEALGQILEPFGHVGLPDLSTDGVEDFVYWLGRFVFDTDDVERAHLANGGGDLSGIESEDRFLDFVRVRARGFNWREIASRGLGFSVVRILRH